ncbi:aromatic-ring-hydroxylating dioxygenase subunit beta [Parahaliea mediterranea]|uniref:aromatic-ring-hydroxylating dioxygenase subunit beta n=1 Tax=Parahaliea mediterranea TaxID=651086 RepID=UPI000E2E7CE2|nr:aromatic-ring-hydroxylating dioxygenase subunit beta [Parahaliea mediterranea]
MNNSLDIKAVETFLYEEAALLDRPDLDNWMKLFTEDGTYWMPAREDQLDALNHVSHMYDDRVMMEIRRRNFVHPRASSKDSPVRSSHLLGNIRHQGKTKQGDLRITCNFHVVMWYREEQRVYAGTCEHHLVSTADGFRIRHKRVDLINPEAPQKSLIIYL